MIWPRSSTLDPSRSTAQDDNSARETVKGIESASKAWRSVMRRLLMLFVVTVATMIARFSYAEETMPQSSEFAIDLCRQLDTQTGNLSFSPLSVRAALAMTAAGAKGKTLEEMNNVLRLRDHQAIGQMLRDLAREPKENDAKLVLRI